MIKHIVLLTFLFLIILPASAMAAGPDAGIIEGRVINGTGDGGSVAGLEINLISHQDETDPGITATTDAEGNFRFEGLSLDSSYVIYLYYQDVLYLTQASFEQDLTTTSTEITVYDTTTSDDSIKVSISVVLITAIGKDLQIKELINFNNEGDKTYVGSEEISEGVKKTLSVSLPKEASEVTVLVNGEIPLDNQINYTDGGFAYTEPLSPGVENITQMQILYWVRNISKTSFDFAKVSYYPTNLFALFVQDTGVHVTSNLLTAEEPYNNEGTLYFYFTGTDINRDTTLTTVISGLPGSGIYGPHKGIGAALLLITGVLGTGYILKRRFHPFNISTPENSLEQEKERLLQEIATLDDDFEEGEISSETYEKIRSEKKEQLIELIHRLEARGDGE